MRHLEGARHAQRIRAALSPSVPNSSSSSRSAGMAEQFTTTNGPSARLEPWWISRATRLLAGAGGTGDQHAAAGRRHAVELAAHVGGRARGADERHLAARAPAQARILAPQPVGLDGAVDHQQQAVGLERLLDEVVGAGLDGRHGGVDRAVAADHHHRHRRLLAADHFQELQTIELAALQPDVEDHQRRPALPHGVGGLGAVVSATGGVALILQDARDQRADVAFVVDDQNIVAHDSSNCPRSYGRIIVRPSRADVPTRFPSRLAGIPD